MGKGAIRAGIEVRLQETGLKNLDGIFLAGAFGNNVRVKSPKGIGLLPRIRDDRITTVGNAADTVAIMSLLSKKIWKLLLNYRSVSNILSFQFIMGFNGFLADPSV